SLRRTEGAHRLRQLELLGRGRRQVVRLQRLLDQPRRRGGRAPRLPARSRAEEPRRAVKFCRYCSSALVSRVPRWICDECGEIHYQNPKLVLGTIPEHGERILLCRRAIEPRYGYWTLPAGFMENGETAGQGAVRETLEEAGARVEL